MLRLLLSFKLSLIVDRANVTFKLPKVTDAHVKQTFESIACFK